MVQPEFVALVLGLAIYTGAFIAEIVRSGILARQQGPVGGGRLRWACRAGQTLRFVVMPQALRVIIPPQTSQYLNLTKNSSLAVAIGYPDFFNVAGTINNQTGQAVEVIAITMGVYLTLSLITSLLHELVQRAHGAGGALSHGHRNPRPPWRRRSPSGTGPIGWMQRNLFATPFDIVADAAGPAHPGDGRAAAARAGRCSTPAGPAADRDAVPRPDGACWALDPATASTSICSASTRSTSTGGSSSAASCCSSAACR